MSDLIVGRSTPSTALLAPLVPLVPLRSSAFQHPLPLHRRHQLRVDDQVDLRRVVLAPRDATTRRAETRTASAARQRRLLLEKRRDEAVLRLRRLRRAALVKPWADDEEVGREREAEEGEEVKDKKEC